MATPSAVPTFSPRARWQDFFQGFGLPFAALPLIFRSVRLLALTAISIAVTGAALAGLVLLLGYAAPDVTSWIWTYPGGALRFLWYALLAVVYLLLLVVGASTVPVLLLAPLQDPFSEATEALCGGYEPPASSLSRVLRESVRALGHTLLRVTWLLLGHAVLFALHFLPGIGQLLWTVAAPLWTMGWLAAEYLDGPMLRHGYSFPDVRRTVWARLGLCMGFGAAVYVILWVPVLNFFFLPLAIVGGTLLYRGLDACGALPGRAAEPARE